MSVFGDVKGLESKKNQKTCHNKIFPEKIVFFLDLLDPVIIFLVKKWRKQA